MKHKPTKPYEIGGAFRCCIMVLEGSEVEETEGECVPCPHCGDGFVFKDGVWKKWDRTEEM